MKNMFNKQITLYLYNRNIKHDGIGLRCSCGQYYKTKKGGFYHNKNCANMPNKEIDIMFICDDTNIIELNDKNEKNNSKNEKNEKK